MLGLETPHAPRCRRAPNGEIGDCISNRRGGFPRPPADFYVILRNDTGVVPYTHAIHFVRRGGFPRPPADFYVISRNNTKVVPYES